MKRILTILLTFITLSACAQIQTNLPANSRNYGSTTFLSPDGMLWYGTAIYKYRGVYPATKIDSLLALIPVFDASLYYTKTASDARFYPLSTNPAGYLTSFTEVDPTVPAYAKTLSAFSVIKTSTDALYPTLTGGNASGIWNINIFGNAETVTNGVYSTGSYANPSWITSLPYSKITGTPDLSGYARLAGGNSFTGIQTITDGGLTVNGTVLVNGNSEFLAASDWKNGSSISMYNNDDSQFAQIYGGDITSSYTAKLPSKTGTQTFAMLSDIPSLTGYELLANKQDALTTDGTGVKYPTVDAINTAIGTGSTIGANTTGSALMLNGYTLDGGGPYDDGFDYIFGRTTGTGQFRTVNIAGMQGWLNLGTSAYKDSSYFDLQVITEHGRTTTITPEFSNGTVLKGAIGGHGISRSDLQLEIVGPGVGGGHTIMGMTMDDPDEEMAITQAGKRSDGAYVQLHANFTRFVDGINTVGSYSTSNSSHLPGATEDNTPYNAYSNNSLYLLAGATSALPWETMPRANTAQFGNVNIGSAIDMIGSVNAVETPWINFPSTGKAVSFMYRTDAGHDEGLLQSVDFALSAYKPLNIGATVVNFSNKATVADAPTNPTDVVRLTDLSSYQGALSLTTTGTSGASTLVGNTLNIPQYSSSLTASNGLTLTSGNVELGGSLTKNTTINMDGSQGLYVYSSGTNGAILSLNGSGGGGVTLGIQTSSALVKGIAFDPSEILVSDHGSSTGMKYAGNYAANYTDRSIPDVQYVNNNIPIAGSFSGAGTATTTFTVTIGQTMANTTYKVNVTPTSSLSAALFYVTNKTTTTFDVVYLAGLTGTVTFDYSIFR